MQRSASLESLLMTPQALRIQKASIAIPRRRQWQLFIASLILMDFIMIGVGFRAAYFFRFEISLPLFVQDAFSSVRFYRTLVMILIPVWIAIFALLGLYNRKYLLGGTREYALVFDGTLIGVIVLIAASFFVTEFVFARAWLILAFFLTFLCVIFGRFVLRRTVYQLRQLGYFLSPAVIVGANTEGFSLAEQLLSWRFSGLHIFGFVDKKFPVGTLVYKDLYTLGSVEQLYQIVNKYNIEEIILASSAFTTRDNLLEIFKTYGVAKDVNVRMSSGLYEVITTGPHRERVRQCPPGWHQPGAPVWHRPGDEDDHGLYFDHSGADFDCSSPVNYRSDSQAGFTRTGNPQAPGDGCEWQRILCLEVSHDVCEWGRNSRCISWFERRACAEPEAQV